MVSDKGRLVRSELVRLRLWATPRLEAPGAWFEYLGNGVALTMVTIPAGSFLMGSPPTEPERNNNEGPQHQVNLEGFWISQTPITQAQWREVMDDNPSKFQHNQADSDRRPVEQVNWHDAIAFCNKLTNHACRAYSLPSESQWEYICRAGFESAFHLGVSVISELANFDSNHCYAGTSEGINRKQTSPVAIFPANSWGLHDLHGNVREWCLDHWHDSYQSAPVDGSAWLTAEQEDNEETRRVLRGGSWRMRPSVCRAAFRSLNPPRSTFDDQGFRVVCMPQDSSISPQGG